MSTTAIPKPCRRTLILSTLHVQHPKTKQKQPEMKKAFCEGMRREGCEQINQKIFYGSRPIPFNSKQFQISPPSHNHPSNLWTRVEDAEQPQQRQELETTKI